MKFDIKNSFKKLKKVEILLTAFALVAAFGFYTVFAAENDNASPEVLESDELLKGEFFTADYTTEDENFKINNFALKTSADLPSPVLIQEFPVSIEVDGKKITTMTRGATVADILYSQGIELNDGDVVNLPLEKEVSENDHISVARLITTEVKEISEIKSPIVYKESSLLKNGTSKTLNYGSKGSLQSVYEVKTVNGKVVEKNLIEEDILVKPTDTVILVGKTSAPISDLDLGYSLDSNGVPTSYKYVLTNQVATGYSSGPKARGASGMRLFYGYVATNPNKIPYGTHMYITSPDNSFVYGYAIAADTGTGLMQDIIDVDLFYETYAESCLNGRRMVNIYILN